MKVNGILLMVILLLLSLMFLIIIFLVRVINDKFVDGFCLLNFISFLRNRIVVCLFFREV